jgi:hypothetical protein
MTSLDNDARRIREAFDRELAVVHAPADLVERARQGAQRRARNRRAGNRRLPAIAGLVGATGAAALTATVIWQLAAAPAAAAAPWSVTHGPGGRLIVTIRELRDPAGLQRRLRADGVPATVRFSGRTPRSCLYYPLSPRQGFRLQNEIFPETSSISGQTAFTISTTAIPPRIGLWITVSPPSSKAVHGGLRQDEFAASWTLIYASGRCPSANSPRSAQVGGVVGGGAVGGR